MKRDLKLEWFHPHPPAEVWRVLTTPELISEWLMQNDFKLEVGHRFRFTAKPMPGWCGIVDCQVLEIDAPRKLVYTWVSGPKPGDQKLKTVVTWHLVPVKGGTRLVLEHTGFSGAWGVMTSFMLGSGWKGKIAKTFSEVLEKQRTHA
jgi:uncharacterized protein YndB with AHSA1/START domain